MYLIDYNNSIQIINIDKFKNRHVKEFSISGVCNILISTINNNIIIMKCLF